MDLKNAAREFPPSPGVYLMKDAAGRVLYVGKAANLKKRISSYFGAKKENRYQIEFLMRRVGGLSYIVTDTEKEAYLLENNLIKKHRPRYNINLRDDKSYASLKLSVGNRFPRLYVTRNIKKDGSLYFGPYASAEACYETVEFIERHFRLRTCSDHEMANRVRPCLQHQIHRCDAPCVGKIDVEAYRRIVNQVRLFLQGEKKELVREIEREMQDLAAAEEFEKASVCRDLIDSIRQTLEKQKTARHRWLDQDAIGFYREGTRVTLCVLIVREGKVWESRMFHVSGQDGTGPILEQFLNQFYGEGRVFPDEILIPVKEINLSLMEEILSEGRGNPVRLLSPAGGDRRDLIALACKNAREGFKHRKTREEDIQKTLAELQNRLRLQNFPQRIECFDISNLSGREAVGSLVSFLHGEKDKSGYRRFRIRTVAQPNDFAMMQEVLRRRLVRGNEASEGDPKWERPDLILIDGGKGHLNAVLAISRDLNLTGIDFAALAKAREGEETDKAYLPGRKNPVLFKKHSNPLHLLMRIRDEAHRFAVAYHKKLRQKSFLE